MRNLGKRFWRGGYLFLGYSFLYIPIFILMFFSFVDADGNFSWEWYQTLFADPTLLTVTRNSLLVAVLVATFSTALGTLAAIVLSRYRFMGRKLLSGALFSYMILPDIVIGISLLILLHLFHIDFGFLTLFIGHATLCLPFVTIMINSRLHDLDTHLFESAKDLGASELTLVLKIILPLLLPAIIGAWLMCFTLSMDDMIISFFLTGPDFQVLPLYIYSMVRLGITPEINAICTIIFIVTLALILGAQWGMKKR